jgi:hypothetical protein
VKVPWSRVHSWHCIACGECCKHFKVPLTFWEYLKFRKLGVVEERRKYYLRKINGRCPFQIGRFCGIQESKPLVCKLFPFTIRQRGDDSALFYYGDDEYYVYVDVFCRNIVFGGPSFRFKEMVREALEIYTGKRLRPKLLTC